MESHDVRDVMVQEHTWNGTTVYALAYSPNEPITHDEILGGCLYSDLITAAIPTLVIRGKRVIATWQKSEDAEVVRSFFGRGRDKLLTDLAVQMIPGDA